ncbi:MAG: DUF5667 domain-containing protein [Chloroflexaceae bacterium]
MQRRDFSETLDEALERLRAGENIEECLEHYPDAAHELEPLLRAASMVRRQTEMPLPPDMEEWLTVGRREIETLARQTGPRRVSVSPPRHGPTSMPPHPLAALRRSLSYRRLPRLATLVLVALMLVFVTSIFNTVSASSVPGDMLYPWKLTREAVTLALTPDPARRSMLRVGYANQRVTELQVMATQPEGSDPEQIAHTVERLDTQVQTAINEANQGGTTPVVQQQLATMLDTADSTLNQLIGKADLEAEPPPDQPSDTNRPPDRQAITPTARPTVVQPREKQQVLQAASRKIDTLKQELPRLASNGAPTQAGQTASAMAQIATPSAKPRPTRKSLQATSDVGSRPSPTTSKTTTRPTRVRSTITTTPGVPDTAAPAPSAQPDDAAAAPLPAEPSTPTATATARPGRTPTATPTNTPEPTATPTATPEPTATPTATPEPTATPSVTPSATPSVTPSATPEPTATPSVTPSTTPSATPTDTPEPTATPTATPEPTATPSVTPSATPSATPSVTPSATPSATPSVTPTPVVEQAQGVRPILECIANNADGTFTAYFGYENLSDRTIMIPYGKRNQVTPAEYNELQPEEFELPEVVDNRPGRTGFYPEGPFAFVVTFPAAEKIVWTLNSRTTTAAVSEHNQWCETLESTNPRTDRSADDVDEQADPATDQADPESPSIPDTAGDADKQAGPATDQADPESPSTPDDIPATDPPAGETSD